MNVTNPNVWYLRRGRKRRSRGRVIEEDPRGFFLVEPAPPGWNRIYLTPDEIAAGGTTKPKPTDPMNEECEYDFDIHLEELKEGLANPDTTPEDREMMERQLQVIADTVAEAIGQIQAEPEDGPIGSFVDAPMAAGLEVTPFTIESTPLSDLEKRWPREFLAAMSSLPTKLGAAPGSENFDPTLWRERVYVQDVKQERGEIWLRISAANAPHGTPPVACFAAGQILVIDIKHDPLGVHSPTREE
jgi:hypothetical protein